MRLHPLSILISVPAIFLACSSGGQGSATVGPGAGAFGSPGASTPALSPITGGGAQTPDPEPGVDSGTQRQDTGTVVVDTGTKPDTATGSPCTAPSKCSDVMFEPATCETDVSDATCGAQARAYYSCLVANQKCTAEGTTDFAAISTSCASAASTLQTCRGA
jgi:hypothetical protein